MVDFMLPWKSGRIKGRPDGTRRHVSGGIERLQDPAAQCSLEVRQRGQELLDIAELRCVETNHRNSMLIRGRHASRSPFLLTSDTFTARADPIAASRQIAFSIASSKLGENGCPRDSARRNSAREARTV